MDSTPQKEGKRYYLVFVYGTLKKGFYNHDRIFNPQFGDFEYLYDATTKGIMYDLGPYPAVDIEGDGIIHGEVYRVDENILRAMDYLEGYPVYYDRSLVDISSGEKAFIYHMRKGQIHKDTPIVPDGIWKKKPII